MNNFCKQFRPWQKSFFKINCRVFNFDNRNKKLIMNEAYFKHLVDEKKIAISFRFVQTSSDNKKVDRVFNFVRDLSENVEVSLNRIKNNLEKELTKKQKKKTKKGQEAEEPAAEAPQVRLAIAHLMRVFMEFLRRLLWS